MMRVGVLLKNQGRLEEAKVLYERALEGREKALGDSHPSTLMTVNNLAILLKQQGRLEEANILKSKYCC
jgi:tetratricopeptide (TPR) repeat protein